MPIDSTEIYQEGIRLPPTRIVSKGVLLDDLIEILTLNSRLPLVLEGDLCFGDLKLFAGDFHVAAPTSSHPPGRTVNGCLVHVVMSLDQH